MKLNTSFRRVFSAAAAAGLFAIVAVTVWETAPSTALAKKGGGGASVEPTFYDVEMTGDLTIVGYFQEGALILDPSGAEGRSDEYSGIAVVVNRPRPAMCISNAFLSSPDPDVALSGDDCVGMDGVIPSAPGKPNWGSLVVEKTGVGTATVSYRIGETDAATGKTNRYTLKTTQAWLDDPSGTWPNGTGSGTTHTVTVMPWAQWTLVQDKPGKVDTQLTSQDTTTITFTEK